MSFIRKWICRFRGHEIEPTYIRRKPKALWRCTRCMKVFD